MVSQWGEEAMYVGGVANQRGLFKERDHCTMTVILVVQKSWPCANCPCLTANLTPPPPHLP